MMNVLGIHLYPTHETGAAIIRNGTIAAAVSEERLSRKKMDQGFPKQSIQECLRISKLEAKDIDVIAIAGLKPSILKDMESVLLHYQAHPKRLLYGLSAPSHLYGDALYFFGSVNSSKLARLEQLKKEFGFDCPVKFVEHHLCHNAAAYFTSGWKDCLAISIDGSGDNVTSTVNVCGSNGINRIAETKLPHSAGLFYKHVTRIFGFNPTRHAGKITGLAAYGQPTLLNDVRKFLYCDGLQIKNGTQLFELDREYFSTMKLPKYYTQTSRENVAASFQIVLEEVMVQWVKNAIQKTGLRKIALSGGVAGNVKANQRIREIPEVEELYVLPPMGDVGLALGAALQAYYEENPAFTSKQVENMYLGEEYSMDQISQALSKFSGLDIQEDKNIESYIGDAIADKVVIGRLHGRMEYGPRALGNRTIMADPRDPTINDWLNERMHRSEFMPFAPSTLMHKGKEMYRNFDERHFTAKFMTVTYDVTDEGKRLAPACTHVDQTARPQMVDKEINPSYFKAIEKYYQRTGIPCVINTSFNAHEEPIVCSPEDAIQSFLDDTVDVLCLENFIVKRKK